MFQTSPSSPTLERRAPDADGALHFQRCLWCGTAMYQRLLCVGCGSTDLRQEHSEGEGAVCGHRNITAEAGRWPVLMNEGFVVRCRIVASRWPVRPGDRVRLIETDDSGAEPVVELCDSPEDMYGFVPVRPHPRY